MRVPRQKNDTEAAEKSTADGAALRCHCGSLLARLVPQGGQIKCRRCKRRVVIPVTEGPGA